MDFQTMLENALDDVERKNLIIMEACDIQVDRANLALTTYEKMEELTSRANGLRAASVNASGDFDKLTAFYEEEAVNNSENNAKKEGLIRRAWEAIKKWWRTLKEKFLRSALVKKLNGAANDDDEGEVPEDVFKMTDAVSRFVGNAKAFAGTHKVECAVTAIAAATTIGGFALYQSTDVAKERRDQVKTVKKKWKDVKTEVLKSVKASDSVDDVIDKLEKAQIGIGAIEREDLEAAINGKKGALGKLVKSYLWEGLSTSNLWDRLKAALHEIGAALKSLPDKVIGFFKRKKEDVKENKENEHHPADGSLPENKRRHEPTSDDDDDGADSFHESADDFGSFEAAIEAILGGY